MPEYLPAHLRDRIRYRLYERLSREHICDLRRVIAANAGYKPYAELCGVTVFQLKLFLEQEGLPSCQQTQD